MAVKGKQCLSLMMKSKSMVFQRAHGWLLADAQVLLGRVYPAEGLDGFPFLHINNIHVGPQEYRYSLLWS